MAAPEVTKCYKLLTTEQWAEFQSRGAMDKTLTPLDSNDGYIHMSTAAQAAETYDKYFKGKDSIVLVEIDLSKITVKWEESRGGQLFPHCYDSVPISAVIQQKENVTPEIMNALPTQGL